MNGPCVWIALLAVLAAGGACRSGNSAEPGEAAAPGRPATSSAAAQGATMSFTLASEAFDDGGPIPVRHSVDGENVSPPLSWSGTPAGAKQLALIVDDPDAPRPTPWVHWVLYGLPATTTGLGEAVPPQPRLASPAGAVQGPNDSGTVGWSGPGPPPGKPHRYIFTLYALDVALELPPGLTKDQLLARIDGHILARATVTGTYRR